MSTHNKYSILRSKTAQFQETA